MIVLNNIRPLYFTRYVNNDFIKSYYNADYYLNNSNRFNHYILTHCDNHYKYYLV